MVTARSKKRSEEGIITLVDALMLFFILMIVSIFILSFLHTGFFQRSDVGRSQFRREAVIDIQEASINSIIEETGYINKSGSGDREVIYRNITIKSAILNYLYLSELEMESDELNYDLNGLKNDIEERYEKCVWDISHYRFALEIDHSSSEFFISNVEDVNVKDDLPSDRSAASTFTSLGLESVRITLYIWR